MIKKTKQTRLSPPWPETIALPLLHRPHRQREMLLRGFIAVSRSRCGTDLVNGVKSCCKFCSGMKRSIQSSPCPRLEALSPAQCEEDRKSLLQLFERGSGPTMASTTAALSRPVGKPRGGPACTGLDGHSHCKQGPHWTSVQWAVIDRQG